MTEVKKLKTSVRVTFDDGEKMKLTYPQWEVLSAAEPYSGTLPLFQKQKQLTGEVWVIPEGTGLSTYVLTTNKLALGSYEVTTGMPLPEKRGDGGWGWLKANVLTDRGLELFLLLGHCPPRDEWPGKEKRPLLGKIQQMLLNSWPKEYSEAIPDGAPCHETSRWRSEWHVNALRQLVKMEMVERGVEGLTLIDGKISIDALDSENLKIVYRMTPKGSLFKTGDR